MDNSAATLAYVRRILASGEARRLREELKLSRTDLARQLQVAESTVYRWEIGARAPRAEIAIQLAELYGELIQVAMAK